MSYTTAFKTRAVKAVQSGRSIRETAKHYKVHVATLTRWVKETTENATTKETTNTDRSAFDNHISDLKTQILMKESEIHSLRNIIASQAITLHGYRKTPMNTLAATHYS